jgi:hypothetical protein
MLPEIEKAGEFAARPADIKVFITNLHPCIEKAETTQAIFSFAVGPLCPNG